MAGRLMPSGGPGSAVRHFRGWRPDRPDHRDICYSQSPAGLIADIKRDSAGQWPLPGRVDLRPHCPSVSDQGQIGWCTAFAAASAMEYLYLMAGKVAPRFAQRFIYYVSRVQMEGEQATDDSGCEIRDVMKALRVYGACEQGLWPTVEASFGEAPPAAVYNAAKANRATAYYRLSSLFWAKASLSIGFPVIAGFSVPQSMATAECNQTGMVRFPGTDDAIVGAHCVLLVGYDDANNCFIFKNSWGTDWGSAGYGYLPYQFVTAGICSDLWTLRREQMPASSP